MPGDDAMYRLDMDLRHSGDWRLSASRVIVLECVLAVLIDMREMFQNFDLIRNHCGMGARLP